MDKWKMDIKKREVFHIITPSHQERIFMMMRYVLLTMVCIITSSCGYKPAKEEIPLFTLVSTDDGKTVGLRIQETSPLFPKEYHAFSDMPLREEGECSYKNNIGWDTKEQKNKRYHIKWQQDVKDNRFFLSIYSALAYKLNFEGLDVDYLLDMDRDQRVQDYSFSPSYFNFIVYLKEKSTSGKTE